MNLSHHIPPTLPYPLLSGGPYRQLLEDPRFCPPRSLNQVQGVSLNTSQNGQNQASCDGRFVVFGAQGT